MAAKRTLLLVIDMQNFFEPMVTNAVPKIEKLHKHFAARDSPVIFTQHGHPKEELTLPSSNQLVNKWGPDGSLHRNTKGKWELIPSIHTLQISSKSPVVDKNTYDAFINTNLASLLEERKVERVVVVGVMTDCCCDTTARSAFNRGYETWLVKDACGSASKAQHEAGLRGFGFAFGEVLTTNEVIERLEAETT